MAASISIRFSGSLFFLSLLVSLFLSLLKNSNPFFSSLIYFSVFILNLVSISLFISLCTSNFLSFFFHITCVLQNNCLRVLLLLQLFLIFLFPASLMFPSFPNTLTWLQDVGWGENHTVWFLWSIYPCSYSTLVHLFYGPHCLQEPYSMVPFGCFPNFSFYSSAFFCGCHCLPRCKGVLALMDVACWLVWSGERRYQPQLPQILRDAIFTALNVLWRK